MHGNKKKSTSYKFWWRRIHETWSYLKLYNSTESKNRKLRENDLAVQFPREMLLKETRNLEERNMIILNGCQHRESTT